MGCSRYGNGDQMHAILSGEQLETVDCLSTWGRKWDVVHRMNEGYRAWGVLKSVLSNRGLGIKTMKFLYERVIVSTALYGAEAWGMRRAERRKVKFLEMKCLRSLVGVSRVNRVRNKRCVGELQ